MLKLKYCIAVMVFFCVQAVSASVLTKAVRWAGYYSGGEQPSPGSCTFTASDLAPLDRTLTLVVGNNVPSGTILHSWGYAEFISSMSLTCVSNGYVSAVLYPRMTESFYIAMNISNGGLTYIPSLNDYLITSTINIINGEYNGVAYRHYATLVSSGGGVVELSSSLPSMGEGGEVGPMSTASYGLQFVLNNVFHRLPSGLVGEAKVRADLVKVGNGPIKYGTAYGVTSSLASQMYTGASPGGNNYVTVPAYQVVGSGSGIRFLPPLCRAVSQGPYVVSLSRWGAGDSSVPLPRTGPSVPVNIAVECNGGVNDVQFSFQDAGASPQTNGSVGLYDASGNKISGLEAEVRYNNTLISVGTSSTPSSSLSKVSVGARTGGAGPYTNRTFTAAASAPFTVNYKQRGLITRGGTAYLGPVSGRVNIFVTYN